LSQKGWHSQALLKWLQERFIKRALPAQQGKDAASAGKDFFAWVVTASYLLRKMSIES